MNKETGNSRLKSAAIFVICDLAITGVVIALYALLAQPHSKTATKPLDLKTEIMKAEEETPKHTGR